MERWIKRIIFIKHLKITFQNDGELYDLEADRSEMNVRIEIMPVKVKELGSLCKDREKRAGVITWGDLHPVE
jgi:hypothetical protein